MKILVLSNTPWDINNSFGNSFSNIFSGISGFEFANIYCRYGELNNEFNMRGFQITEKSLIANLKNSKIPSGREITPSLLGKSQIMDYSDKRAIRGFNQARKMRWQIMFWVRDLIWKIGRWKSKELNEFLDDFKPDIIFQPIYYSNYICDIALFIKKYTTVPMIGYISDDNYTLRQFELSPLYWIDRLYKRRKVKAVIDKCELLYVISQIQKEEYERIFHRKCKILTKCAEFNDRTLTFVKSKIPLRLLYAGNLGMGRWKSIALIVDAVEKLNASKTVCEFEIYSATPQTNAMKKAFNRNGTKFMGSISYEEVQEKLNRADIVIHVEGLSQKSRMAVHQSFSTKLVDYFSLGKCILAVGTDDEASIKHLIDNKAAVVCQSKNEVYEKLKKLVNDTQLISEYGKRAYNCGVRFHDKREMQKMIVTDMKLILDNTTNSSI